LHTASPIIHIKNQYHCFIVDADYDQLGATPEVAFILRSPVNLLRN